MPRSGGQVSIATGMPNLGVAATASSNPDIGKIRRKVCRIRTKEANMLVTELWGTKAPHYKPWGNKRKREPEPSH